MKFIHTDSAGNKTTDILRSTGCYLARPPRHRGPKIKIPDPRSVRLDAHAKCCPAQISIQLDRCDCGVYGLWRAVNGGKK